MPNGGTLSIRTSVMSMDETFITAHGYGKVGEYAVVAVTDTGTGIQDDIRDKIFEPFFTTKGLGKGTGLGLATAYGIMKQHNGFINMYSEKGLGTTFRLYFCRAPRGTAVAAVPITEQPEAGSETVLLVDDDDMVRKSYREILENFGYTVIEAGDGEEAIRKFAEFIDSIDVMILDVITPKRNGHEVYDTARKLKADVKVLFMSGYAGDLLTLKKIFDDNLHFLEKPVAPNELLGKVREALAGR
jgi:CheY-like chemotaxis protein